MPVTWDQVIAYRLVRHRLLRPAPAADLLTTAADINGAQAQLHSAAQLSLWTRLKDLAIEDLDQAMAERKLVKAACMRRTLFLVPADQLAVYVRGSAQRAQKEYDWARKKGLSNQILDAAIDAALEVLDQPLTRPEIAEKASRILSVQVKMIHGGGWGNRTPIPGVPVGDLTYPVVDLLHLAGSRGVVCYGPDRGNEPTFVRADAWIPGWQDVPVLEAEEHLLLNYLHAFGPAAPEDYSMWTGMTLAGVQKIWQRVQEELVSVTVEERRAGILRSDLDELVHSSLEDLHVRLLPYFDTFLLGHRDRNHLVGEKYRTAVYRPQGWIAPTVLVDGRITAVWGYTRGQKGMKVKVSGFEPLSSQVKREIEDQVYRLGRFLGVAVTSLNFEEI